MEDVWTATIMFMKPLGFVYCPIMKNMHSQMLALLGRIGHNRKKLRVDIPGELADAWATIHYPNNENVTYGVFGKDVINTVNGSKKVEILAIIRDPFDRFISAHGNMCIAGKICNDSLTGFCEDNFECMLAHLLKMSKYCTWREFSESSLAIHHFVPQAYYCYLRKLKPYTNLVVYNNTAAFRSGLRQFLITRGVPKSEINRGWGENNGPWLETASFHNTRGVSRDVRKKIFSNITLLKTIYEIYKVDFEMFSFEMPPVVCQYCRNPKNFAENICAK